MPPKPPVPSARPRLSKEDQDLLFKGIVCALIGLAVLAGPHFASSPAVRDITAQAAPAGWFGLVLGLAFIGRFLLRMRRRNGP